MPLLGLVIAVQASIVRWHVFCGILHKHGAVSCNGGIHGCIEHIVVAAAAAATGFAINYIQRFVTRVFISPASNNRGGRQLLSAASERHEPGRWNGPVEDASFEPL